MTDKEKAEILDQIIREYINSEGDVEYLGHATENILKKYAKKEAA